MGVFLPIGVHHVWSYAKKVGRDPAASLVADLNALEAVPTQRSEEGESRAGHAPMSTTHKLVLGAVGMALAVMVGIVARPGSRSLTSLCCRRVTRRSTYRASRARSSC